MLNYFSDRIQKGVFDDEVMLTNFVVRKVIEVNFLDDPWNLAVILKVK